MSRMRRLLGRLNSGVCERSCFARSGAALLAIGIITLVELLFFDSDSFIKQVRAEFLLFSFPTPSDSSPPVLWMNVGTPSQLLHVHVGFEDDHNQLWNPDILANPGVQTQKQGTEVRALTALFPRSFTASQQHFMLPLARFPSEGWQKPETSKAQADRAGHSDVRGLHGCIMAVRGCQ